MKNDPFDYTQGHPEQGQTDDNLKIEKSFRQAEYQNFKFSFLNFKLKPVGHRKGVYYGSK